jgi:hypothetical protein
MHLIDEGMSTDQLMVITTGEQMDLVGWIILL